MVLMAPYRRLPLTGLHNARELGGYAVPGGVTKYGVFLRSEVPAQLTQADIDFLRRYGVTTVLDFRSAEELRRTPDVLRSLAWIDYIHLPLFDPQAAAGALGPPVPETEEEEAEEELFSWGSHYIRMAASSLDWIRDTFSALAAAKGCTLFHCTTGKDRTGVIAALLLGCMGAAPEDIVADYSVSQLYLREMYRKMAPFFHLDADGNHGFFSTAPANMEALLAHLDATYGSLTNYLTHCGITDTVLAAIQGKFLEKADFS